MNVVGMKGRAAGAEPALPERSPSQCRHERTVKEGSWGNHGFPKEFEEMTANG